jgi:hypothetical protein
MSATAQHTCNPDHLIGQFSECVKVQEAGAAQWSLETTHADGRRLGLAELIDSTYIRSRLLAIQHKMAIGNEIS